MRKASFFRKQLLHNGHIDILSVHDPLFFVGADMTETEGKVKLFCGSLASNTFRISLWKFCLRAESVIHI